MLTIPTELSNVKSFLEEFRASCPLEGPTIATREGLNDEFIESSGITPGEINYILLRDLNDSHYFKGPGNDPSPMHAEGVTYVFKYPWEDFIIYIKLKVPLDVKLRADPIGCVCISFHEDNIK